MVGGDGTGCNLKQEIDAVCLKTMRKAQADGPRLHILLETLRVVAKVLGREARWMEACDCHEDMWTAGGNFSTRRKKFSKSTNGAYADCPWKGKRSMQMALGRSTTFFAAIMTASSPRLQELLARVSGPQRTAALEMMRRLQSRLVESLTAKLEFWNHIPWSFCAIWTPSWKKDARENRTLILSHDRCQKLRQACEEYDRLVAGGHGNDIPRTAHRLFGPGILRAAMDRVISWGGDA